MKGQKATPVSSAVAADHGVSYRDTIGYQIDQANRYEGSTDDLVQQVKDRVASRGLIFTTGEDIDPNIWTPEKVAELKSVIQHIRDSEQTIKGGQG